MSSDYPRGSEWRKWDLHVHTPLSLVQHYGSDNDATWEKYISDLEALPPEYKVLGINDYLFIEGYKRLKKEKYENGRLQNIDLLLPVIEFRIEKFAGVDFGSLQRINYHVIFSDEVDVDIIESQFLATLHQHYILEKDGAEWQRTVTKQSIEELGATIKSTVPATELSKYGSDIIEGFNAINIKDDQIKNALKKDCFKGKFLTAVGKTEWDGLAWTDASIATKKSIINDVDIVFTSAESLDKFNSAKAKLKNQGVNDLLLDCSDAHRYSTDLNKDRIGNSLTWIKSDPTFEGLKQIIYEPNKRVFAGEEPPIFASVRERQTRFIDKLSIGQVDGYDERQGEWFKGVEIPLNSEMVAIIGNKGSGKSALADILGLLGESKNIDSASFLNAARFKKAGLSKNFEASITWKSGDVDTKNLHDGVDATSTETIKFLPQRWFEDLCNDLEGKQFSKELEKVVYTHLDTSETLGYDTFEKLIEFKSASVEEDIRTLRNELHDINEEYETLLKKTHPDYRKELDASLLQKQRELDAHLKIRPEEVVNPDAGNEGTDASAGTMAQIQSLDTKITQLQAEIQTSIAAQTKLKKSLEDLGLFSQDTGRIKQTVIDLLSAPRTSELFGDAAQNIVTITIDEDVITAKKTELQTGLNTEVAKCLLETDIESLELGEDKKAILKAGSLSVQITEAFKQRDLLKKQLQKPQELYQKYLEALKSWSAKKVTIEGTVVNPAKDTINFYKQELAKIGSTYTSQLDTLNGAQINKSKQIFSKKNEIVTIYAAVKTKVDSVIAKNQPNIEDYEINIEAGFTLAPDFNKRIMQNYLNLRSRGSFMGQDVAHKLLNALIEDKELNKIDHVLELQRSIVNNLRNDNREEIKESEKSRNIGDQVMNVTGFFDYIYGLDFLYENYQLQLDKKNIESLSPGEKGALLLVFYLMLDQDDTPLVIDQPEDNLDNQSVARILVEFINSAKTKRQIILITHNPNLAVVADAEQIIYAQLNKTQNHKFAVWSGSIEDDETNRRIVDVLEGTRPAFDQRRLRYLKEGRL